MTDAIEVAKAESAAFRQEAESALPDIEDFVIQNDDDKDFAADLLREVKDKHKAVEGRRKEITVPLNKALRGVNDLFRPALKALEEGEKMLKSKIVGYVERRDEERKAALLAASQTKDAAKATEALSKAEVTSAPEGVNIRYRWVFEVTDPDQVPRELCSPDPKKIGAMAAGTEIPGVVWKQEPLVTARKVK